MDSIFKEMVISSFYGAYIIEDDKKKYMQSNIQGVFDQQLTDDVNKATFLPKEQWDYILNNEPKFRKFLTDNNFMFVQVKMVINLDQTLDKKFTDFYNY